MVPAANNKKGFSFAAIPLVAPSSQKKIFPLFQIPFPSGALVPQERTAPRIVVADFNKDGATDYAVPSAFNSTITVYLGHGDGTFAPGVSYPSGGTDAQHPVVADFNSDTYPDLALLNYNSNSVGVLLNQGDGTFGAAQPVVAVSLPSSLAVGDFNGDTKPDLLVTGITTVEVLYGAGNGTFPNSETLNLPGKRVAGVRVSRQSEQ